MATLPQRRLRLALLVPLVLLLGLWFAGTAQAQRWSDLTPSILDDYGITENQVAAISEGFPDNTWRPYQGMTRAQFVKMAVDRFGLELVNPVPTAFADVPRGHQYFQYIETAHAVGLVEGRADGLFSPFETITRVQAAAIIVRFLAGLEGTTTEQLYSPAEIDAILAPFQETRQGIGPALADEMAAAVDWGILRGTQDARLNPFQSLLRIQGAAMLIRTEIPDFQMVEVFVYFVRDGEVGSASRTLAVGPGLPVAAATMSRLLAGPTQPEVLGGGMSTEIPAGTRLLDLSIQGGVATVDLSEEFRSGGATPASLNLRLAQVVYTLTQFAAVDTVEFRIEGQALTELGGVPLQPPVGRPGGFGEPFEDVTPAIFVESPAIYDEVTSPVRVTGTANVFEATFILQIRDDNNNRLADVFVTAASGTGTRGTFDVTVPFAQPQTVSGTLVVFWESAQDGSPQDTVQIPVVFGG
jgi:germination protein M